jgi:hypothetical protein
MKSNQAAAPARKAALHIGIVIWDGVEEPGAAPQENVRSDSPKLGAVL